MFVRYVPLILFFLNQINVSVAFNPFLGEDEDFASQLSQFLFRLYIKLPNSDCKSQFLSLASALNKSEEWAMQMIDATAKPQAGILSGNILHAGNYDECLEIHSDSSNVHGKYCTTIFGSHPKYGSNLDSILNDYLNTVTKTEGANPIISDTKFSWGFCVPKVCTAADLQYMATLIEDELEFPLHFTFVENYCDDGDHRPFTTWAIVAIAVFSVFGLLLIMSTIYDVFFCRHDSKNPDLLLAFSVVTNGKKILSFAPAEGNLGCLNGLRVISMVWILFAHSAQSIAFLPHINAKDLLSYWNESTETTFLVAAHVAVDTFFVISGLLVVYLFMKSRDKGVKFSLPMFYLHRIIRLTPSLIMITFLTLTLVNYMGRGPFWPVVDDYLYKSCEKNWWSTLIYLQNYINPTEQCVGQAWYLAVDTQMYFLSPLIFFPLMKWPKQTIGAIIVFVVLNCSYVFEITWKKHLGTTFFDQNDDHLVYIYVPTHVRGTVYLMGMVCGYFVYKTKTTKSLKLSKRTVMSLWILSLSVLVAILLTHSRMYKEEYTPMEASFFNALIRVGWSLAICIIILLCTNDYGGPINSFLSCQLFTVLIRLNYGIYLVHLPLIIIVVAQERTSTYFSGLGMIHYFWGDYFFSLGVAILWTLAFESPILTIEKIIFGGKGTTSKKCENNSSNGKVSGDVAVEIDEKGISPSAPKIIY